MDIFTKEKRSEIMRKVKSKDTRPEKKVRSLLHSLGYRFRLHRKDLPGKPDIVLPKYKTVIFVHGCFWHGHEGCRTSHIPKSNSAYWANKIERNIERDFKSFEALQAEGWSVIVVWECDISDVNSLSTRLLNHLKAK